jgi:very-short-patch-repair endonuclease
MKLTEITKTKILDELLLIGNLHGELSMLVFLGKIWNLKEIKSTDRRFENAEDDIHQHMIRNHDWDESDLYSQYFALPKDSDMRFFEFIKNYLHPLTRKNQEEIDNAVKIIDKYLINDNFKLQITDTISNYPFYEIKPIILGVKGEIKNIIFASSGAKPEIILKDAINNEIEIVKNQDICLIYDEKINDSQGLTWNMLVDWWKRKNPTINDLVELKKSLYVRLEESIASNTAEKIFFRTYYKHFKNILGDKLPALIPQVYLHYDPKTIKELANTKRLVRQRMDFLLLLSNKFRIVLEIDGKQHYTKSIDSELVSPEKYAEMVKEDRRLKLSGYEIYRFGGYEFFEGANNVSSQEKMIIDFFCSLFKKYGILD